MKFGREKVITVFTADKEMKGGVGWLANSSQKLRYLVENNRIPEKLDYVDTGSDNPFRALGKRYMYFYPVPHEHTLWFWLNHHKLKIGDKVRVVRNWSGSNGCYLDIYEELTVTEILDNGLWGSQEGHKYFIPYFAIEKVEYRPFNMEEFAIYRNRWWIHKETGDKVRFDQYCEDGLLNTFRGLLTWQELLDDFTDESGNPAGIKL